MTYGFAFAYVLTIAIETAVAFLLLRKKYGAALIIRNSIVASSLTLPFVWFVFPFLGFTWVAYTALAEIFAFAVEAGFYRVAFPKMGWPDAVKVSFLCNAASFAVGLLLVF
jgi:hypothetical protein